MKASDVVGRTIVAVEQSFVRSNLPRQVANLDYLVLDNGSRIGFDAIELESADGHGISATVYKRKRKKA